MRIVVHGQQAFGKAVLERLLERGEAIDLLLDASGEQRLEAPRHVTRNTHGTGCTLSSAIAAGLAKGEPLEKAVRDAKVYITAAIIAADELNIGEGRGPVHHFHALWPKPEGA